MFNWSIFLLIKLILLNDFFEVKISQYSIVNKLISFKNKWVTQISLFIVS